MNGHKNSIIDSVPAAGELRKVPGFNPLRYLHLSVSDATGQRNMKLDLPYKRLWFRLACPRGKMMLNPLRITDQMAIFEARLYADQNDAEPIANFTSTKRAKDVPGGRYIRDAQDEALNEALDNAGFGIQLCDFARGGGEACYGSEIPLAQILALAQETGQILPTTNAKAPTANSSAVPAASARTPVGDEEDKAVQQGMPAMPGTQPPKHTVDEVLHMSDPEPYSDGKSTVSLEDLASRPDATESTKEVSADLFAAAPAANVSVEPETGKATAEILQMLSGTEEQPTSLVSEERGAPQTQAGEVDAGTVPTEVSVQIGVPSYHADMSVEDICARMTVEEAKAITVDFGTCKGNTLGWVLDRRPSSLRYYVYVAKEADNVLKAAASLLLNEIPMKQAG